MQNVVGVLEAFLLGSNDESFQESGNIRVHICTDLTNPSISEGFAVPSLMPLLVEVPLG